MADSIPNEYPDRVTFRDRSGVVRFFRPSKARRNWADGLSVLSWLANGSWILWDNVSVQDIKRSLEAAYLMTPPKEWAGLPPPDQVPSLNKVVSESQACQWILEHGLDPPDCEAMKALEIGDCPQKLEPIEVYDEDSKKAVMFDPSNCQSWRGKEQEGETWEPVSGELLEWEYQTLYRHLNGKWVLLIEQYHCEATFLRSFVQRLSDEKAAHWLFWHKFEVPAELQCFTEEFEFDINSEPTPDTSTPDDKKTPNWNSVEGILIYRGIEIRRVRGAAANVRTLLNVFQEEEWPHLVYNPFPDGQKLREAIASLNTRLQVIRFKANGTGEGVLWELGVDEMGDEVECSADVPF